MLLKQSPIFSSQFKSKGLIIISIVFFGIVVTLAFLPWRPKYPVEGVLKSWPDIVSVRAKQEGIIKQSDLRLGQKVHQGQILFKIMPISYLLNAKANQFKYKNLELILQKLALETAYQKNRLNQLQPLLKTKVVTQDFFHQVESDLRNKEIEYRKVLGQLKHLKQAQLVLIQAPVSGNITSLEVQNSKMIKKGNVLLAIQPLAKNWEVFFKLPLAYKSYLKPNSLFKLTFPSHFKIKRYLIHAKLSNISGVVIHRSKSDYLYVHAKILNDKAWTKKFIPNMPLKGFLLGPQYRVWQWLLRFFSIQ